ncbi:MAG: 50S ribosomal protein L32e [Thermoplasmatales archaeon]|nr:50S ribosomal protein L32e [Thermoplasmatales archaeon]
MTKKDLLSKLKKIKGVDDSKAKAIYDAGFTSWEKLKKADAEQLSKVKGVNKELAKTIIEGIGKKEEKKEKTEKKEEKEKVEIVEKEIKKIKPNLSKELKEKLKLRSRMKKRKPEFLRQEWFRYRKLGMKWRKAKGIQSKMKKHVKYRTPSPRIGYSSPKDVKGLHSSGFKEIMVYNINEIDSVNKDTEAIRIGHSVGAKKRNEIEKKADDMGIKLLNRGQT